jgi:hypothetical protein
MRGYSMNTNNSHLPKSNRPDSDEAAREKHKFAGDEQIPDASPDIEGLQTSNKMGKHSSVEKLAASRPEFGASPGARPVDGAFGDDLDHPISGREAAPDTNQFRCNACGRYFNSEEELTSHEQECRLAKAATASGRKMLQREDATPHMKNDVGT